MPPIFGSFLTSAGKSEKSSTATTFGPRSSANKISVLLGASEIMRAGGAAIVTLRPATSVMVNPAAADGGAALGAAVGTAAVGGAAGVAAAETVAGATVVGAAAV